MATNLTNLLWCGDGTMHQAQGLWTIKLFLIWKTALRKHSFHGWKVQSCSSKERIIILIPITYSCYISFSSDNMIRKKELRLELDQSVFWTDSTTVLNYFTSEKKDSTCKQSGCCMWVEWHRNPAYEASRGFSADDFLSCEWWQHFLLKLATVRFQKDIFFIIRKKLWHLQVGSGTPRWAVKSKKMLTEGIYTWGDKTCHNSVKGSTYILTYAIKH